MKTDCNACENCGGLGEIGLAGIGSEGEWDTCPTCEGTGRKPEKNPAAVALGKLGASKGGRARAAALTPERRSEIARQGAEARWKK